jgi:ketosteroid isomerase-like protein
VNDWKSKNLEGLRTLYAQNAVFLPADGTWVEGRDAIGDYLRQVIDSNGNSIIVPDAPNGSGEASGDLAYDSGFIQYWIKGNNGPVKGFYLMLLKRDSEGKWHIVRHALTEISTRYSSPSK